MVSGDGSRWGRFWWLPTGQESRRRRRERVALGLCVCACCAFAWQAFYLCCVGPFLVTCLSLSLPWSTPFCCCCCCCAFLNWQVPAGGSAPPLCQPASASSTCSWPLNPFVRLLSSLISFLFGFFGFLGGFRAAFLVVACRPVVVGGLNLSGFYFFSISLARSLARWLSSLFIFCCCVFYLICFVFLLFYFIFCRVAATHECVCVCESRYVVFCLKCPLCCSAAAALLATLSAFGVRFWLWLWLYFSYTI